jgi:hypothetical protein
VGAGLLSRREVEQRLYEAALVNGLVADDGKAQALATIKSGVDAGVKMPRDIPESARAAEETPHPEEAKTAGLIWYGDSPPTPPSYFADETLPETGVATIGGQYGAAKTFVAADLASATMIGGNFAGKPVRRTGGVLWLAAEGESEIETRIQAAIVARGGAAADRQPFARQAGGVPCLADKDALARLKALAGQAAERLKQNFKCELALIVIDTLSAAADLTMKTARPKPRR